MPTYHARGITIRLVAAHLATSTSPEVHRARTGTLSQTEADRCEEIIREHGKPLLETPVPCDDNHILHLLETPAGPVPLLVTRADRARLGCSCQTARQIAAAAPPLPTAINTRSSQRNAQRPSWASVDDPDAAPAPLPPPPPADPAAAGPYALGLRIDLPRSLFTCDHRPSKPTSDVRYDVFFNGEVAASNMFVVAKFGCSGSPLTAVVSGKRVDFHIERPWVVVGPGRDAAGLPLPGVGGPRRRSSRAPETMAQRWAEVNSLLEAQAQEMEMLQRGSRTPVLECLYALAGMAMPKKLESLPATVQKPGIIDVVISMGEGTKGANTAYLRVPEVMPNRKIYGTPGPGVTLPIARINPFRKAQNEKAVETLLPPVILNDDHEDEDYVPVVSRVRGRRNETSTGSPKRNISSLCLVESPPKRRAPKKREIAVTDTGKKSLVEKRESPKPSLIVKLNTPKGKAGKNAWTPDANVRQTRAGSSNRGSSLESTNSTNAKTMMKSTKSAKPNADSTMNPRDMFLQDPFMAPPPSQKHAAPSGAQRTPRTPANPAANVARPMPSSSLRRTAVTAAATAAAAAAAGDAAWVPTPWSSAPRVRCAQEPEEYAADMATQWRMPAGSEGSVATFAPIEGPVVGGGHVFRQVHSSKRGAFEEDAVMLAVRFVVP